MLGFGHPNTAETAAGVSFCCKRPLRCICLLMFLPSCSAVAEGRLRSEAPLRLAKRSRDLRRGGGAWDRAHTFDPHADEIEPLIVHSIADKTALYRYVPQVRRFLAHAVEHRLCLEASEQRDLAVAKYLCMLAYSEEKGPAAGDCLLNGLQYIWPEFQGTMPRAWKCLHGWHKVHIHGEGGPEAVEVLACMEQEMRRSGADDDADALALAVDCYLRTMELFLLRVEDLAVITVDGVQEGMIRLGVAERAESTKTGMRQGVRIDSPYVLNLLQQRCRGKKPSEKIFESSASRYRHSWHAAVKKLGLPIGPPHSARHSGPSHDAATGYRTMWQIQRRGRWSSERSVLRYAKTHTWLEVRSKVPAEIMERGAALLAARPQRPDQARE